MQGKNSAGDCAVQEIERYLKTYSKGMNNLYSALESKIETALNNAPIARKIAESSGTDNPTAEVDILIRKLRGL